MHNQIHAEMVAGSMSFNGSAIFCEEAKVGTLRNGSCRKRQQPQQQRQEKQKVSSSQTSQSHTLSHVAIRTRAQ